MLRNLLLCSAGFCMHLVSAGQGSFHLSSGASLKLYSGVTLVLSNSDFAIDGDFKQLPGAGTVVFTGQASSSIKGSAIPYFDGLTIATGAGDTVNLLQPIHVSSNLTFESGMLDLRSNSLYLDSTGILMQEQELSHATATLGGTVIAIANLNAPSLANPGNLGAYITSAQNLGSTTVIRSNRSRAVAGVGSRSIQQVFQINPANDVHLNATLGQHYLNAELNGFAASQLAVWTSPDGINWTDLGSSGSSTNELDLSGIDAFSEWTLSSNNGIPLPVTYLYLQAGCISGQVEVKWATALQSNSKEFNIQRSGDGTSWQMIGSVTAAGNSFVQTNYSFTDAHSLSGTNFYRILEVDLDGHANYSKVIAASCRVNTDALTVWPNPAGSSTWLNITSSTVGTAFIRIYDMKGNKVLAQQQPILAGANQLLLQLTKLTAGTYEIRADWGINENAIVTLLKR